VSSDRPCPIDAVCSRTAPDVLSGTSALLGLDQHGYQRYLLCMDITDVVMIGIGGLRELIARQREQGRRAEDERRRAEDERRRASRAVRGGLLVLGGMGLAQIAAHQHEQRRQTTEDE
jgi:hypothetical protein